jgi:hypothetical protein
MVTKKQEEPKGEKKAVFEINKKIPISADGNIERPTMNYGMKTVFRSVHAEECKEEWIRKEYTPEEYVMDVRIATGGGKSLD